jgi:zinc transport system substrate-binding protein
MRIIVMKRLAVPSLAALVVVTTAACGSDPAPTGGAGGGSAGLDVAAAFYPLQYVTEAVGGDRVEVENLTTPGAEPHDLELAPRQVAQLGEADLAVYLSGFQPAVDDAVAAQAPAALDVAQEVDLVPAQHADEHGDEPADEHADESVDPHFWLDPVRLADAGDAVAARLAELDPEGAQTYEANAARLREELQELDAELSAGLASCDVDILVTSHAAFGYLADRYGFTQVGISGLDPDSEPDPRAIAEVADLVRESGVTTVYSEVLVDPAVAETVAAEAGATTAVLDPVEGITDRSAGDDYPSVMRANLQTLREGQGCS